MKILLLVSLYSARPGGGACFFQKGLAKLNESFSLHIPLSISPSHQPRSCITKNKNLSRKKNR